MLVGEPGEQGHELSSINPDNSPGMSIEFRVAYARRRQPGKATIKIYNVSDDTADMLKSKTALVRLSAGHITRGTAVMFEGNPVPGGLKHKRQGGERVLVVECQDGGRRYRVGRVSLSYGRETPALEAFNEIVRQTGYPKGKEDLSTALPLVRGWAFEGTARDALDELAGLTDREWFVRDGRLFMIDPRSDTGERVVVVSAEEGNLVDSPTPVLIDDLPGLEVTAQLIPEMRPGRLFKVESKDHNGYWVAKEVSHAGTSFEGDFQTVMRGFRVR